MKDNAGRTFTFQTEDLQIANIKRERVIRKDSVQEEQQARGIGTESSKPAESQAEGATSKDGKKDEKKDMKIAVPKGWAWEAYEKRQAEMKRKRADRERRTELVRSLLLCTLGGLAQKTTTFLLPCYPPSYRVHERANERIMSQSFEEEDNASPLAHTCHLKAIRIAVTSQFGTLEFMYS